MKRYLYSIFLILGLGLALSSCSRHDDYGADGPGTEEEQKGDMLSLRFSVPLPEEYSLTRDYSRGDVNEITIQSVRAVLYGSDQKAAYSWDFDAKLDSDGGTGIVISGDSVAGSEVDASSQSILITLKAKKLHAGAFKLLVIVNPNDVVKDITNVGDAMDQIESGTFATFDDGGNPVPNSLYRTTGAANIADGTPVFFLMLNHQGLVEIDKDDFYATAWAAERNPVQVGVERAAAKVTVDADLVDAPVYIEPIYYNFVDPPEHVFDMEWMQNPGTYGRFVMLLDQIVRMNNDTGVGGPGLSYLYWPTFDYDIPDFATPENVYNPTRKWNRITKKNPRLSFLYYHETGLGIGATMVRYLTACDIMWHVDVVNKEGYFLRHMTNKADGSMELPGQADRQNFYAEDPNFTEANTDPATDFVTLSSFSYTDGKGFSPRRLARPSYAFFTNLYDKACCTPSLDLSTYWSWTGGDGPIYIPVNTMETDAQRGDMTTRVIFEISLKRDVSSLYSTNQPVSPFFVFKGGRQVRDFDIHNNEYYENGEAKYFYIIRPEHMAAYASGFFTEDQIDPVYVGIMDEIDKFKLENPAFDFDGNTINNNEAARSENLIFYPGGKLYYAVPIEHFTTSEAGGAGEYGRFGVVRNNSYNLTVEQITTLGELVIPAPSSDLIETTGTRSSFYLQFLSVRQSR